MPTKEYALVVAGGRGTRIKSTKPKQFIELNGLPLLLHTLLAFDRYSKEISIVLVLPEDEFGTWRDGVNKYRFNVPVVLQHGGETRFQSVRNGLQKISGPGLVAIHDGVRPLVSVETIRTSFQVAAIHKTAVAAVRLKESIRMNETGTTEDLQAEQTKAVDRSRFRLIQTPQTFDLDLIRKAYEMPEDPALTDDASVAERAGHAITLFEGTYDNIKVTTPEDLIIAEALLKKKG